VIAVRDAGLRALILLHMAEQVEGGELQDLAQAGLPMEELDRLSKLTVSDLAKLSEMRQPEIQVLIKPQTLAWALTALEWRNRELDQIAYFVTHGASLPMLRSLFKASTGMIKSLRQKLYPDKGGGRPMKPAHKERERIHVAWHESAGSDIRERLIALHQQFKDYPLDSLYSVINEFEEMKR
jgi:hypothetical protein